jgi:predicted Zn-dependent protease
VLGTVTAAQGLAAQQQINFTRANETEADRVGIGVLAASGFDPGAMPDFFWTMQQRSGSAGNNIPDLLRTHPVTTERIAESRDRVQQHERQGEQPRHEDSTSYALIRERLAVQSLPPEAGFRDLYRSAGSADLPSTDGQRYGRALALLRADAPEEAIPVLQDLRARRPDVTLYHTALGQAQLADGRIAASRATLEEAMKLFPRSVPVTMRYAETLLRDGDPKRAHVVLLDLFNFTPPTPEQARFIALAANAAGDVGDAYYYMSEFHVISGNLALAIDQLRLALAVPGLNGVQRQRFEARMSELQEYLPRGRREKEIAGPSNPQPDGGK